MSTPEFTEAHQNLARRDARIGQTVRTDAKVNAALGDLPEGISAARPMYRIDLPHGDEVPDLSKMGLSENLAQRVHCVVGIVSPGTERIAGRRTFSLEEWEGLKARLPAAFEVSPTGPNVFNGQDLLHLHPGDRLAQVEIEGRYRDVEGLIVEEYIRWVKEDKEHRVRVSGEGRGREVEFARKLRINGSYDPTLPELPNGSDSSGLSIAEAVAHELNRSSTPLPSDAVDALFIHDQFEVEETPYPLDQLPALQEGEWVIFSHPNDQHMTSLSLRRFMGQDEGHGGIDEPCVFRFLDTGEAFSQLVKAGVGLARDENRGKGGTIEQGQEEGAPSVLRLSWKGFGEKTWTLDVSAIYRIVRKEAA